MGDPTWPDLFRKVKEVHELDKGATRYVAVAPITPWLEEIMDALDEIEKARIKCIELGTPIKTIFITDLYHLQNMVVLVHDKREKHLVISRSSWLNVEEYFKPMAVKAESVYQPSLMGIPVVEDDERVKSLVVKAIEDDARKSLLQGRWRSPNELWPIGGDHE